MRKILRLTVQAVILLALASCSLFDYSGITPKKYALVYGVTMYTLGAIPSDETNPNLQYPSADAKSVVGMLKNEGFTIEKSRWVDAFGVVWVDGVSTGSTIGDLSTTDLDGRTTSGAGLGDADAPSKTNIIADIAALKSVIGTDDLVLLYFSGHGMPDTQTPPSTHQYIVPYGGLLRNDIPGPDYLYHFGYPYPSIRDDELGAYLGALATSRKVLVLDTCNSGGFIGNQLEADSTPPFSTGAPPAVTPNILAEAIANYASFTASETGISPYDAQVIAAAGRDESSYESADFGKHGVMTWYFLETASSADLDKDGVVTVLEAFAYIKAGIDVGWNSNPGTIASEAYFEPHVSGGPVDFVLF